MTHDDYNGFCRSLIATTYIVQWGGSHVWKVGGKVFAISSLVEQIPAFTFKTSELSFEILKDMDGLRPAPYLASRGFKWIQHYAPPGLDDEDLKDYIRGSHHLVSLGLSKKKQRELGLIS